MNKYKINMLQRFNQDMEEGLIESTEKWIDNQIDHWFIGVKRYF